MAKYLARVQSRIIRWPTPSYYEASKVQSILGRHSQAMFAAAFAHPEMHDHLTDGKSTETASLGEILYTLHVVGASGRYSEMANLPPFNFLYR